MLVQGTGTDLTSAKPFLAPGRLQAASAAVPCVSHNEAVMTLSEGLADPILGPVSIGQVQICPQHAGVVSEGLIAKLQTAHPQTKFRMHASPRLKGIRAHKILDACNAFEGPEQIEELARLSRLMAAPAYTLHAGPTAGGTLKDAFDNTRRLRDLFECPVGIEGLYPAGGGIAKWLLGTWEEHAALLTADVDYALDLSHINIMVHRSRRREDNLIRELLASPRCIELHLSDNNGRADAHLPLKEDAPPWWLSMLDAVNDNTVIFYEGVLKLPRRMGTPKD